MDYKQSSNNRFYIVTQYTDMQFLIRAVKITTHLYTHLRDVQTAGHLTRLTVCLSGCVSAISLNYLR
jgi:hypothetical protein